MTPPARALSLGTRGSALAQWQARRIQGLLAARGVACDIVVVRTAGDEPREPRPGTAVKGLFTKEIEDALLAGDIDVAVHSLKDLAVQVPDGLVVAAFPERADPRDAVVSRSGGSLSELPAGARVGTSSLRRRAAITAFRQDLEIVDLSGNVPTRLKRVDDGTVDAAVVALAGLTRLGLADRAVPLPPEVVTPAPGQGTLALEARAGDSETLALLRALDDPAVRCAAVAERAALGELEGGCNVPIGAHCRVDADGVLRLRVVVYDAAGGPPLEAEVTVSRDAAEAAGRRAAGILLERGAARVIERHARLSAQPQ